MSVFAFRVFAQLLQATFPVGWLPAVSQWQGSSLPYPVLLAIQLLIILVLVVVIWKIRHGSIHPDIRLGRWLFAVGSVYFIVMLLRLLLGLTLLASVPWFAKTIPAFFHLVLACILLLVGHYHYQHAQHGASR